MNQYKIYKCKTFGKFKAYHPLDNIVPNYRLLLFLGVIKGLRVHIGIDSWISFNLCKFRLCLSLLKIEIGFAISLKKDTRT